MVALGTVIGYRDKFQLPWKLPSNTFMFDLYFEHLENVSTEISDSLFFSSFIKCDLLLYILLLYIFFFIRSCSQRKMSCPHSYSQASPPPEPGFPSHAGSLQLRLFPVHEAATRHQLQLHQEPARLQRLQRSSG